MDAARPGQRSTLRADAVGEISIFLDPKELSLGRNRGTQRGNALIDELPQLNMQEVLVREIPEIGQAWG